MFQIKSNLLPGALNCCRKRGWIFLTTTGWPAGWRGSPRLQKVLLRYHVEITHGHSFIDGLCQHRQVCCLRASSLLLFNIQSAVISSPQLTLSVSLSLLTRLNSPQNPLHHIYITLALTPLSLYLLLQELSLSEGIMHRSKVRMWPPFYLLISFFCLWRHPADVVVGKRNFSFMENWRCRAQPHAELIGGREALPTNCIVCCKMLPGALAPDLPDKACHYAAAVVLVFLTPHSCTCSPFMVSPTQAWTLGPIHFPVRPPLSLGGWTVVYPNVAGSQVSAGDVIPPPHICSGNVSVVYLVSSNRNRGGLV